MTILQHLYFIALFSPGFSVGPLNLKFFVLPILVILCVFKVIKSLRTQKMLSIYFVVLCSVPILSIMQNYLIDNEQFRPSIYMHSYFYFNILYALFGVYLYRQSTMLKRSLLYSALIILVFLLFDVFKVDYSFFSDASPTWKDYTDRGKIYRPGGLSGDPNRAAISIIIIFILLCSQTHTNNFLNYSVLMLGFVTQSRTFSASFILSFFKRIKILYSTIIVGVGIIFMYLFLQPVMKSIVYHSSMLSRYRYWGNLGDFDWLTLFGNGLGSSLFVSLPYQFGSLHNSWLTVFFELGIVGFSLYLISFYQACIRERLLIMLLPYTITIDFMYSQAFLFMLFWLIVEKEKVN